MKVTALCHFIRGDDRNITLDAAKTCPWCKTSYNGTVVVAACESYPDGSVGVTHLCAACSKMFFATYHRNICVDTKNCRSEVYSLIEVLPHNCFQTIEFSDRIKKVSPQFQTIYNQAAKAENDGLTEICGLGYRRSIEFLIKDFVINRKPDEAERVLNMPLAQCIKEYIENENVKHVAARVVWLGNDHAHYVSKHTDKDLSDLKALVSLTVKWIDMELETEEFMISVLPKK